MHLVRISRERRNWGKLLAFGGTKFLVTNTDHEVWDCEKESACGFRFEPGTVESTKPLSLEHTNAPLGSIEVCVRKAARRDRGATDVAEAHHTSSFFPTPSSTQPSSRTPSRRGLFWLASRFSSLRELCFFCSSLSSPVLTRCCRTSTPHHTHLHLRVPSPTATQCLCE